MRRCIFQSCPARVVVAAALAICALPTVAQSYPSKPSVAQSYPSKPVRVIVPFAPGGGSDLTARPVSQRLSEALGQQFVVDNRGGAAGVIGMELTAKANPDGYTIMMMSGSFSATPATQKLSFDPLKEIVPIIELGYSPHVMVVHPSIAAKTTIELIEYARAKPGTLPYASTGLGGFTHLGTELFLNMAKIKMIHVPYKSTGAAMVDVLSGQCPFILGSLPGTMPHFKSGRLRALAVTSEARWPTVPELPTVTEALPGYTLVTWYGVMAPRGTPAQVIQKLNAEVNKILQASDVKKMFEVLGMAQTGGTIAKFDERIRSDHVRWVRVVKEAGLKIQ
jgi:tripartite-type tricarboxylate transporter receptor subunit TctC